MALGLWLPSAPSQAGSLSIQTHMHTPPFSLLPLSSPTTFSQQHVLIHFQTPVQNVNSSKKPPQVCSYKVNLLFLPAAIVFSTLNYFQDKIALQTGFMVSSSLYPQHIEPVVMNGLIKSLFCGMCNAWVISQEVVHSFNKHGPGIVLLQECGAYFRQRESLTCPQGMQSWENLRKMWYPQLRRFKKPGAGIQERNIAELVIVLTLEPSRKQKIYKNKYINIQKEYAF